MLKETALGLLDLVVLRRLGFALLDRCDLAVDEFLVRLDVAVFPVDDLLDDGNELLLVR